MSALSHCAGGRVYCIDFATRHCADSLAWSGLAGDALAVLPNSLQLGYNRLCAMS